MAAAILLLGHAVLGALALPSVWLKSPWRARFLMGLALIGAGLGVALVVFNGSQEEWRTARLSEAATVVGFALAVSWLVVLVTGARAGGSSTCCLVGLAGSALAIAATNDWIVPALLFWICSSLAVAALAAQGRGGIWVWGVVFASDVALAAALLGQWVDTSAWTLPDALDGWRFYILLLAVGLRAGVVPTVGVWGLLGRSGAPAVPLLVGGAFALLPMALGGEGDPWSGVVLFVVAVGVSIAGLGFRTLRGRLSFGLAAPIAAFLGLAVMAPAALAPAGIAALIAAMVAALWPASVVEAGRDRVAALTALPPLVGLVAAVTALGAAVEHTVLAEEVIDKVPWTLALVLAPAALTALLAYALRLASRASGEAGWWPRLRRAEEGALVLLITRVVLLFAVAGTVLPGEWLGFAAPFSAWEERKAVLFGAAILLAVGAAWWVSRRAHAAAAPEEVPAVREEIVIGTLPAPRPGSVPARVLTVVTLLLAIGVIAAVGWLTFEGLRLGFL